MNISLEPGNDRKLDVMQSLNDWLHRQQDALERVADAIRDAETMLDYEAGERLEILALQTAVNVIANFRADAGKRATFIEKIRVAPARTADAAAAIESHAGVEGFACIEGVDLEQGVIEVRPWMKMRAMVALRSAKIRTISY